MNLKKSTLLFLFFISSFTAVYSQAFVANVEAIYGGRINTIAGDALTADSFKLVVATESANSIFFATVKGIGTLSINSFTSLPSANAAAGFGSGIMQLAYHANSRKICWGYNNDIYSATETATSATKLITGANSSDFKIKGNKLVYCKYNPSTTSLDLVEGTLDASGNYTAGTTMSIASWTSGTQGQLVISKNGDTLYVFGQGTNPRIERVNVKFNNSLSFTAATSTTITHTLSSTYLWNSMNVASDGRIFVGTTDGNSKYMAYKDYSASSFTTINTGIAGGAGSNIEFDNSFFGNYYVYFGSAYSSNKGNAGTWVNFGNVSLETHSNDGYSFYIKDALTGGVVAITSDQGLAWTKNGGANITEIDDGIVAVQVNDFDMNAGKTDGWLASKAGIRKVSNYNTGAKTWSAAMFPMGDGSPYYSSEMIGDNVNQAYVGNVRVYKTTDGGSNWSRVFTPETAYGFSSAASCEAIEVYKANTNIVMAGYSQPSGDGGLFYSLNAGSTWKQLRIRATVDGPDIDVHDIVFTTEAGKTVAYVGVEYYNATYNGVYRAEFDGTSVWTVTQNSTLANSGDGITLPYNVADLDVSPTGDTLMFVGTSGTAGSANGYFKIISSDNKWYKINVNSSSLSLTNVSAGCLGLDTLFLSQDNKVAYAKITKGTMVLHDYVTLPVGTQSTCLYYDELLGGSSVGFYDINGRSDLPRVSVPIVGLSFCSGATGTLTTATNATGATYTWYNK